MALNRRTLVSALGMASLCWPTLLRAQEGVSPREVLIGRVTPSSSPLFGSMALQRRTAANAYIDFVNAQGGVHGRNLRVVDVDDAYDAEKASAATDHLVNVEHVFAMLGAFGSPTLPSVMRKIEAAGVPLVGAVTLSDEARTPFKRYVFPVRASSLVETAHVVKHQRTLTVERFAILSNKEAYGPQGASAFATALAAASLKPVDTIEFSSQDDLAAVAARLHASSPQTILASVLPKPFAKIFAAYRKLGGGAQATGFSAIRIEDLVDELGPLASGVGLSQAVPVPTRESVPLVKQYLTVLRRHAPNAVPSYHGLDAYVEAVVLVEGLRRAGRTPTRQRLVAGLESMSSYDCGGLTVKYGPSDRTGSTFVDVVMLSGTQKVVY